MNKSTVKRVLVFVIVASSLLAVGVSLALRPLADGGRHCVARAAAGL